MSGFHEPDSGAGGFNRFMTGSTLSGTPLETRDLSQGLADMFQSFVTGGDNGGRLGAQGIADQFGMDFGALGLGDTAAGLLRSSDPTARLQEFDRVNAPAQQRAITQGNAGRASQFGSAGSRFSRNLFGANASANALQNEGFDRARFDAFNTAGNQQLAALSSVMQSIPGLTQANLAPFQLASQFGAPGAPQFQEGALPGLIQGLSNVGASFAGRT